MKHALLPLLLALLLAALPALAECPVQQAEPLTGMFVYPEGRTEADALYVYRYRYPQVTGNEEIALHINTTYAYMAEDALGFEVPMLASEMQLGDPQKIVDIDFEITGESEDYLSVLVTKTVSVAGDETIVISGHVFALTGSGAGKITSLPVYLGLLSPDETDEWLMNRQTNKADKLVRELVWERLTDGSYPDIYDDLTYEEFEAGFYPEEDYYIGDQGEPCFYFQAGTIAPEELGPVIVPISMDILMDEL